MFGRACGVVSVAAKFAISKCASSSLFSNRSTTTTRIVASKRTSPSANRCHYSDVPAPRLAYLLEFHYQQRQHPWARQRPGYYSSTCPLFALLRMSSRSYHPLWCRYCVFLSAHTDSDAQKHSPCRKSALSRTSPISWQLTLWKSSRKQQKPWLSMTSTSSPIAPYPCALMRWSTNKCV